MDEDRPLWFGERKVKPPLPLWRALTRKLAFVSCFAAVALTITTLAPPTMHATADPARCFNLFVNSLKTLTATGVWGCLNEPMQQGFFALGWKGDADVQKHYFDPFVAQKQHLDVSVYAKNPVKDCKPSLTTGTDVCVNTYLVYFAVINADGTSATSCNIGGCNAVEAVFTITLDKHGLIGSIL